jgi:molybdopterin-guanine dinucleotide biosynthesis protein A
LPPIEENLQAKRLKITRFYGQVSVRYVEREEIEKMGGNGRSFANINTPQDLTQAQKKAED